MTPARTHTTAVTTRNKIAYFVESIIHESFVPKWCASHRQHHVPNNVSNDISLSHTHTHTHTHTHNNKPGHIRLIEEFIIDRVIFVALTPLLVISQRVMRSPCRSAAVTLRMHDMLR
jgi:hypothetical protein